MGTAVPLRARMAPDRFGLKGPRVFFVHSLVTGKPATWTLKGLLSEVFEYVFGVLLGKERFTGLRPRSPEEDGARNT